MKTYKTLVDGGFVINNLSFTSASRYYNLMLGELNEGLAELLPYVEPEKTQEELDAELKLEGVLFNGVLCSATAEDMWGLNAVKDWITAGNTTNFKFSNGNILKLTPENYQAFQTVWSPFRASFF